MPASSDRCRGFRVFRKWQFFAGAGASDGVRDHGVTLPPSPATVPVSGNITLVPAGGTAPYSFAVANSFGSVSLTSGGYTVYTASASAGTAYIQVTD